MIEQLQRLRPSSLLLLALCVWSLEMAIIALAGLGSGYQLHPANPALVAPLPDLHFPAAHADAASTAPALAAAERPLFSVDRRPQAVRVSAEAGQTELKLTLTGVIDTPTASIATFKDDGANKPLRARAGQVLDGHPDWRLVSVTARTALLEGPDGQLTLELRAFDGSGGQAPTPITTTPSAPSAGASAANPSAPTATATPTPDAAVAQAEAIRARIQARRAQLREAARSQTDNTQ
ncbi:MAG: hypothetical protein Q8L45_02595 [Xanthomonadaceae bacterium]|nr:hypothetical protein [Xanthomonadaceae bacterium]MDP2184655.1 hypothetical protein [Xanthomonadales bacterium]MDZ4116141.1 hypothetical protein [Xanthomonadaceae bacterium]MDZ4378053.1 hypothetical protein [Xanthomonadaceae bacterium]